MAEERKPSNPRRDPESAPYWAAAERGVLLLKRCRACGQLHYFPRPLCPFCMSADTEWVEAKGQGEIYSFTVLRRAAPPYAVAYVTLDEGVRVLTNIVGGDFDALRIGQGVSLAFQLSENGSPIAMFTPA